MPLRRVARQAGMSHGHLSKVERGEPGRPVTPAVLSAYEKATGLRLSGVAGHEPVTEEGGWRRGHLSEQRRRSLNARIAAMAVGGVLGEQVDRILDSAGRVTGPERVEEPDVAQVVAASELATAMDLRYGGGVAAQLAKGLLRWAVLLLDAGRAERFSGGLHAAVGGLAQRAGWAAFDAEWHDTARSLLTVALFSAVRADDADLRAHVLADFAAQHLHLGYPNECLYVVRFAEVDERVGPAVLMVVDGVKARAYGLRGDADRCREHVGRAERWCDAAAGAVPGWQATVATEAHLSATTGHALATLSRRLGAAELRADAVRRLTRAVGTLDHRHQARATALCLAQLAALQLEAGERDDGLHWAGKALDAARGLRSVRVTDHLALVRAAATGYAGVPEADDLLIELDLAGSARPRPADTPAE